MKYRMNTATDIKRSLQRVCDEVAEGTLDAKAANTICYCAQTALSVIKLQVLVDEKNDERAGSVELGLSEYLKI